MKKRLFTVLMTLAMAISVMACGDKGSGGSVPATGSAVEDDTDKDSAGDKNYNENTPATGSAAEDGTDVEGDGGTNSSDGQNRDEAGNSGDNVAEETDGQNQPDNYDGTIVDWESVDWNREIVEGLPVSQLIWAVSDMHKSIIDGEETTLKEAIESRLHLSVNDNLDNLDEECRMIIDQLMPLTREEMQSVYFTIWPSALADNYDWVSVDWERNIGGIDAFGNELKASELINISISAAELRQNLGLEEYSSEQYMLERVRNIAYDDLDEESKMILTKLDELQWYEIYVIKSFLFDLW